MGTGSYHELVNSTGSEANQLTAPVGVSTPEIRVSSGSEVRDSLADCRQVYERSDEWHLTRRPEWLEILRVALRQVPYCIEARVNGRLEAYLPLSLVRSRLFGSFLVSLPYLNVGGVVSAVGQSEAASTLQSKLLIDRAVTLAEELDVRYLELRNEIPVSHSGITDSSCDKVQMRLALTESKDELWRAFTPKLRNQIRKGKRQGLDVHFGGLEVVPEFYDVFARNMRDLGTPVFPRDLFSEIVRVFPDDAEYCIVRRNKTPIAAAMLVFGRGIAEVPSASSLRHFNSTNANMLMYWHLLKRVIARGQQVFDFGRSSPGSGTYKFKKQWGARPTQATWQYHTRRGTVRDMRPGNSKYRHLISMWRHLPVGVTKVIGPEIARAIP